MNSLLSNYYKREKCGFFYSLGGHKKLKQEDNTYLINKILQKNKQHMFLSNTKEV